MENAGGGTNQPGRGCDCALAGGQGGLLQRWGQKDQKELARLGGGLGHAFQPRGTVGPWEDEAVSAESEGAAGRSRRPRDVRRDCSELRTPDRTHGVGHEP